jgi:hypothetical protein
MCEGGRGRKGCVPDLRGLWSLKEDLVSRNSNDEWVLLQSALPRVKRHTCKGLTQKIETPCVW